MVVATPDQAKQSTATDGGNANSKKSAAVANLPYGTDEILKMTQGGIEAGVIQSYIAQSTVAYNLSADDILSLHKQGVAPQVVAALIRRGGELRAQSAQQLKDVQAQMARQTPTVVANPNPVSTYAPAPQPATTTYIVESPRYVYAGYPAYYYSYATPFYYGRSYWGYNSFCYPRTFHFNSSFPRYHHAVNVGFGGSRSHWSSPSFRHRGR